MPAVVADRAGDATVRYGASVRAHATSTHAASSTEAHSRERMAADARQVAVASSIASALTKSLLHPLDTLKCRVQVYSTSPMARHQRCEYYARTQPQGQQPQRQQRYASDVGTLHSLKDRVYRMRRHTRALWYEIRHQYAGKWGPRYLYGGLPVKLFFYVPYQATYMTSYNAARWVLMDQYERTPLAAPNSTPLALLPCTIAAAIVAEVSSCFVRVPMETLKMRIQSTVASGTGEAVSQMRRNGLRACARLAIPQTLMHDIPYSIIQWTSYEALRPCWSVDDNNGKHSTASARTGAGAGQGTFLRAYREELVRTFFSGGFSGLVAATLTLPLDNIRTRVVVATAVQPHLTVRDVVRAAYRADGLSGFFRGGSMRILWVSTNMACYFPLFELCRAALRHRSAETS